jgi:hypothetical protein
MQFISLLQKDDRSVCNDEFGVFLSINPVQNHLNSGTICRPFADMV